MDEPLAREASLSSTSFRDDSDEPVPAASYRLAVQSPHFFEYRVRPRVADVSGMKSAELAIVNGWTGQIAVDPVSMRRFWHIVDVADPPSHTCFAVNRLIHTCWPAPQPDWRPSIEIWAISPPRGMTVAVRTRVPASLKTTSNAKIARHEMIHGCAHSTCMLGYKGRTESISMEFSSGTYCTM